eukprot:525734-Pyramimonas_sp.AAC.1
MVAAAVATRAGAASAASALAGVPVDRDDLGVLVDAHHTGRARAASMKAHGPTAARALRLIRVEPIIVLACVAGLASAPQP